jgi:Tannase and feruloyl esterase
MGTSNSATFARFFLLPGVKHCGGGEGPDQIDVLSAIMAWTELGRAPDMLVAGKRVNPAADDSAAPLPYSAPAEPTSFTRPIYPYPLVAKYRGKGDPALATSYRAGSLREASPYRFPAEIAQFFGPDNQSFYEVRGGKLVPSPGRAYSARTDNP